MLANDNYKQSLEMVSMYCYYWDFGGNVLNNLAAVSRAQVASYGFK